MIGGDGEREREHREREEEREEERGGKERGCCLIRFGRQWVRQLRSLTLFFRSNWSFQLYVSV